MHELEAAIEKELRATELIVQALKEQNTALKEQNQLLKDQNQLLKQQTSELLALLQ